MRSKLRHPIRAIREPFGTAGLIVAVIALVLALGGAAVAASGGLSGKQKKEVEKIAKKYAGAPGATGPAGPAGPAGKNGNDGKEGTAGSNGLPGASVTETQIAVGSTECASKAGGVKYTLSGTSTAVCNGKNGQTGFTETLPEGRTETGTWVALSQGNGTEENSATSISFPIPLEAPVAAHFITSSGSELVYNEVAEAYERLPQTECPGSYEEPVAEPGNLCVFEAQINQAKPAKSGAPWANPEIQGTGVLGTEAGRFGVALEIAPGAVPAASVGDWAVTAN